MANYQSILITGASSGIGEALALHYASSGVRLFLSGRDAQRLRGVAEACREKGAAVEERNIDVTDRAAMERWILDIDGLCPVDLVIANAGISGGTGGGGESGDQVRAVFDVNVTGVFNTILPLLPRLKERGRGHIVIMASLAGFFGWPGAPAYSASKAAVRVYGEALRGQLHGTGVRVSVVCPGFVESRMTAVNNYTMPFLMDARTASCIIAKGLAHNRGRIGFPWQAQTIVRLLSVLPLPVLGFILERMPEKPSR